MSDHRCRRAHGEGFCQTCGRFMGDPIPLGSWDVDSFRDPETLDRDPDDNPDDIVYGVLSRRRSGRP